MFLPLIAMMMVACSSNVEMASEEATYRELSLPHTFVVQVVVETEDHVSPIFNMTIPSTTEYWEADADGEWVPKMELISDILMESIEIPSVHESEPVIGKYALLTPLQNNDNQVLFGNYITQKHWDQVVTACWVDKGGNGTVQVAQESYCYTGNTFCFGWITTILSNPPFFLNCLWGS